MATPAQQHLEIPVPGAPAAMARLVRALREREFTEAGCARRLGLDPLLGIQFHQVTAGRFGPLVLGAASDERPGWLRWSRSDDPADILIGLLLAGETVPLATLELALAPAEIDTLAATGLIRIEAHSARSELNLYPISGRYLATDRPGLRSGINPVSSLYPETYILARSIDRTIRSRRTLDLCTGSGVHAILAAGHGDHTLGVDINPRAVAFARFNQALNGLPGPLDFAEGDLYGPCPADSCHDLITANPPYVPSVQHAAGSNWFSGGPGGDEVLSRILGGLDQHLSEHGVAHLYAMLVHHPDRPYRDKMAAWLGDLSSWHVTVQAVPFPFNPTEILMPAPSRYELAVISVRRCPTGERARYQHTPAGYPRAGSASTSKPASTKR